jgi:hypothetical protein
MPLTLLLAWAATSAAPPATAPEISFKDIRYLTRSLDDFPGRKAYVLAFTSTSCPLVGRYLPLLGRLEKEYRDKGVQFLSVNVGADDTIRAMAAHAVEHDIAFPTVKDYDAVCAKKFGVTRTPEVVVLDAARKVRYRGRINDQYRIGGARAKPTREDLKEALDEVLAGKAVTVSTTTVDGCLITTSELKRPAKSVTFADHVAPILRKHCVECHRPGTSAPFSLITYGQVAARASAIAEAVRDESMPPWYGAPRHREFYNDQSLSAAERELVRQWAKFGRARGDLTKVPKPPEPKKDGWRIGKPDVIIQAPEHQLPAEGLIDYKYVVLPYAFLSDTWVQGVQVLPDNPRVLHHCNMAYLNVGGRFSMQNFITGTVPGGDAMTLEPGVGFRIPAGSVLMLQIHYVTTGKKEKCRLSVGLKYASGKIDKHLRFKYLVDTRFAIPPGAPAHKVSASRVLEKDSVGVALFSHMHLRGRDMTFRAHYPGGKKEDLLLVPNYNFDWQIAYRWKPGAKKFPRGTRLEAIAHYDNSKFNPFNPDAKATVREGQQTHHEMMNGFVFYVEADEKLGLEINGKTGQVKAKRK